MRSLPEGKNEMVRARGLEPPTLAGPDPKSGASAIPPRARGLKLARFLTAAQVWFWRGTMGLVTPTFFISLGVASRCPWRGERSGRKDGQLAGQNQLTLGRAVRKLRLRLASKVAQW